MIADYAASKDGRDTHGAEARGTLESLTPEVFDKTTKGRPPPGFRFPMPDSWERRVLTDAGVPPAGKGRFLGARASRLPVRAASWERGRPACR